MGRSPLPVQKELVANFLLTEVAQLVAFPDGQDHSFNLATERGPSDMTWDLLVQLLEPGRIREGEGQASSETVRLAALATLSRGSGHADTSLAQ